MSTPKASPRKAQAAHAAYCADGARHDGQCTSTSVTATVAGHTITAWAVGDPGHDPQIVLDGLRRIDGERLSMADVSTLTEITLLAHYATDGTK